MKSINDLTQYFGYYKSNQNFVNFIQNNLPELGNYDSLTQYIICKKSKIELGFTNERMIRKEDEEKSQIGGKPIFTHFNFYPQSISYFESLPFDIVFDKDLEYLEKKVGQPNEIFETKEGTIWGKTKSYHYHFDPYKIIFEYNYENKKFNLIQVQLIQNFIIESSKPTTIKNQ